LLHILVDADACPVKKEVYRVAARYGLEVTIVANSRMRIPDDPQVEIEVVGDGFDAADDWIVDRAGSGDIVVTADILLAARCLEKGARVIGHTGVPFDAENIGAAIATRELLAEIRAGGEFAGGPPPMERRDRSRFLQRLDQEIQSIRRSAEP
jgi:uncharacterized protein YaiI (UPF0178 family)